MKQAFTLIKHNLNKMKGQFFSFGIIICLTAVIMNIALVLALQTFSAYDDRFTELGTADVNVMISQMEYSDTIIGEIEKIGGVMTAEKHEGVLVAATVREFADADFDMNTVFYNLDADRRINRLEVSAENETDERLIYIPVYMKELGGFSVGNYITYSINGEDFICKVGGTVSEMQYGNYGTGLIGAYLPDAVYSEFAEEHIENKIVEYSLIIEEGVDLEEIKTSITELLKNKGISVLSVSDREVSRQTRTMVCTLLIVIFLALAAIILTVSVFLSDFRIRSAIEDELAQMGVLKAVGYTSGLIILSTVMPYTLVGGIAAVFGIVLSYLLLPAVANVLAIQSGFSYTPVFDVGAFILVLLLLSLSILLFSYISSRKIHRLEPINAIRGIIGKEGAGQNILLAAVSFGIMVLLSFAGTLLYNVGLKPDNFMKTLSEESPSVIFTAESGKMQELKNVLLEDNRTESVLEYITAQVSSPDGSLTAFVCEDFCKVRNDICYEGRNPKKENEIAVGNALAEKYPIGSEIEISCSERTAGFSVTGYVQSINYAGEVCELTEGGYDRIGGSVGTVYVYLQDKTADIFIAEYEEKRQELIATSVNYERLAENSSKIYAGIVSVVTVVLFAISVLLVLLVLYVILGSILNRRKTEFGIYKAVGYTSRQLTIKTALEFLPITVISAGVSAVLSIWYLPAMNQSIFSLIGAMKNHFEISIWILIIFVLAYTVVSFVISVFLAAPIKRITAYSLFKD